MAQIPKSVETYLDNNLLFNKFGIVNIGKVIAETGTTLSNKELKQVINERFSHEMVGGEIEFIERK